MLKQSYNYVTEDQKLNYDIYLVTVFAEDTIEIWVINTHITDKLKYYGVCIIDRGDIND